MKIICTIEFKSDEKAKITAAALKPETGREIPRTEVELKREDRRVILVISASDIPPLRAACNSYLRWIQTAIDVSQV